MKFKRPKPRGPLYGGLSFRSALGASIVMHEVGFGILQEMNTDQGG